LEPVRSLTFDASQAALEAVTNADASGKGLRLATVAGVQLHLVVAPLAGPQLLVHVFAAASSTREDRIAASRAAEALRRQAEALSRSQNAA
jgi:hypothetical protein